VLPLLVPLPQARAVHPRISSNPRERSNSGGHAAGGLVISRLSSQGGQAATLLGAGPALGFAARLPGGSSDEGSRHEGSRRGLRPGLTASRSADRLTLAAAAALQEVAAAEEEQQQRQQQQGGQLPAATAARRRRSGGQLAMPWHTHTSPGCCLQCINFTELLELSTNLLGSNSVPAHPPIHSPLGHIYTDT
jgi:hypothetical protein